MTFKPPVHTVWKIIWVLVFVLVGGALSIATYTELINSDNALSDQKKANGEIQKKLDGVQTELDKVLQKKGQITSFDLLKKNENTIIETLKKHSTLSSEIDCCYYQGDKNSTYLYQEWLKISNEAGWSTCDIGGLLFSVPIDGIQLMIKKNPPSESAILLQRCFEKIGVPIKCFVGDLPSGPRMQHEIELIFGE